MCKQCRDIDRFPLKESPDRLYVNSLKGMIVELERRYATLQAAYRSAVATNWKWEYPQIPEAQVLVSFDGADIPEASGVYFVWREDQDLAYVGQSICLRGRCRRGVHQHLEKGDRLSWILTPEHKLHVTEAFYIGIGRPWLNFGKLRVRLQSETAPYQHLS